MDDKFLWQEKWASWKFGNKDWNAFKNGIILNIKLRNVYVIFHLNFGIWKSKMEFRLIKLCSCHIHIKLTNIVMHILMMTINGENWYKWNKVFYIKGTFATTHIMQYKFHKMNTMNHYPTIWYLQSINCNNDCVVAFVHENRLIIDNELWKPHRMSTTYDHREMWKCRICARNLWWKMNKTIDFRNENWHFSFAKPMSDER